MADHSSATTREHTPHLNQTTRTSALISQTPTDGSSTEKLEALAEIICRAGDESAGALLVLMGTFQHSADPKVLANTVKHFAFTRCGELNVNGMVDAQIAVFESELLTRDTVHG